MSVYYAGNKLEHVHFSGEEAFMVINAGREIYPAVGYELPPLKHRITNDGAEKWFEVCWNSPELLTGNATDGWTDPGGYCFLEIQRSEDLVNWTTGELIDCASTAIPVGDGTYDYWARAIFPVDSMVKVGQLWCESTTQSGDTRNNPITSLTVNNVGIALAGFPYYLGTAGEAARMQSDMILAGLAGSTVVATSSTVWRIDIPNVSQTAYSATSKVGWPGYLIADMYGALTNTVDGRGFAGQYVNTAGVRTAVQKQFFRMRIRPKRRMSVAMLANAMIEGVDSRLAVAAPPQDSMKLFTGIGPGYFGSTYTPNAQNWLQDLWPQLTGFHMGAGGYAQSYALIPIGDRFVLNCAHNGPEPLPLTVKYVAADGTVFTTTATHWINDRVGALCSDTQQPYQTDLMIYVLADPLPAWVNRAPIIGLTNTQRTLLDPYDPPTVAISQGNWTAGPSTPYGKANTPDNRMAFVKSLLLKTPRTALRNPFHHGAYVGDSGTPEYILLDDVLYLYRVIASSNETGVYVADRIDYINSMIARGAAVAGIPAITIEPQLFHFTP